MASARAEVIGQLARGFICLPTDSSDCAPSGKMVPQPARALGRADSAIGHRDGRAEPLDDLRYSYLQRGAENAQPLPERLMQIIDGARVHLPLWLQEALPDGADELRAQLLDWLKAHYGELRQSGK